MSQCIYRTLLRSVRNGRTGFEVRGSEGVRNKLAKMNFGTKFKGSNLGQTSLFLQDGVDIQELPVIVRRAEEKLVFLMCQSGNNDNSGDSGRIEETSSVKQGLHGKAMALDENETKEIIAGFERCSTAKAVFTLLELIPDNEVTSDVALQAFKSIIKLENNSEFKNKFRTDWTDEKQENFTRTAVLNHLVDLISASEDSQVIIEGLQLVSQEVVGGNTNAYRQKLCEEVLIRVADGKFDITQLCNAVKIFTLLGNKPNIDKLWVGMVELQKDITAKNIIEVYRILPFLRQSRRLVLNILEKRLPVFWFDLNAADVTEILDVLNNMFSSSHRTVAYLSRWVNTNIHRLSEDQLLGIVKAFGGLTCAEQGVEKALERYVKAKGLKIQNPAVVAAIMDYCKQFKIRSAIIFDGCSEYFVQAKNLTPTSLKSIVCPYGYLDFYPLTSGQFWEKLEEELSDRFVELSTDDALEIMLACVYLEKYPLNFVNRIFNPYFLDKLHSHKDEHMQRFLRNKLKIFDTAMTLECALYRGPLLPRDHFARSMWQDGRVRGTANFLVELVTSVVGVSYAVSTSVILSQVPLSELYVVDMMVHPKTVSTFLNLLRPKNECTAVLIHVADHYDSSGKHLIGPQVMRRRHFRRLGLKVVELNFDKVWRLKVHPQELLSYLKEQFDVAEHS